MTCRLAKAFSNFFSPSDGSGRGCILMKALAGVKAGMGMPSARSEDAESIVEGSRAIDGAATARIAGTGGATGRIGVATKASAAARSAKASTNFGSHERDKVHADNTESCCT